MKPETILELLLIKGQINTLFHRIAKATSPKTIEKLRDEKYQLRREFADLVYDNYEAIALEVERVSDLNSNTFNVMSMVGGPYHIRKGTSLHAYKPAFGGMQVIFDSYVGTLQLLEDPCGIDNLKILADNIVLTG